MKVKTIMAITPPIPNARRIVPFLERPRAIMVRGRYWHPVTESVVTRKKGSIFGIADLDTLLVVGIADYIPHRITKLRMSRKMALAN